MNSPYMYVVVEYLNRSRIGILAVFSEESAAQAYVKGLREEFHDYQLRVEAYQVDSR